MTRPTPMKMLAAGLLTAAFLFPAPALAQGPRTVGDILPAGVYTASRNAEPLPLGTIEAWRAASVIAVAVPDYARDIWTDAQGNSLGVTRWEAVYQIDFRDGGPTLDAVLVFGNTRQPDEMIATVAYAALGWHCQGAVIVRRGDVGD